MGKYSKAQAGMTLRASALRLLEVPLSRRFFTFCLRKRLLLDDMDRYCWIVCRGYEANRLDLRMRWNAMGLCLEHESL